jgi:hypothetical protein
MSYKAVLATALFNGVEIFTDCPKSAVAGLARNTGKSHRVGNFHAHIDGFMHVNADENVARLSHALASELG